MASVIYGKKPSTAIKKDPKSKEPKEYGLIFPLGSNNNNGYFAKQSGAELIKNNLKQLILTDRGERIMLPNFGMSLRRFLFQPLDEQLFEEIKEEILFNLAKYAKNITVIKLSVFPSDSVNIEGGQGLIIRLTCQINASPFTTFELPIEIE